MDMGRREWLISSMATGLAATATWKLGEEPVASAAERAQDINDQRILEALRAFTQENAQTPESERWTLEKGNPEWQTGPVSSADKFNRRIEAAGVTYYESVKVGTDGSVFYQIHEADKLKVEDYKPQIDRLAGIDMKGFATKVVGDDLNWRKKETTKAFAADVSKALGMPVTVDLSDYSQKPENTVVFLKINPKGAPLILTYHVGDKKWDVQPVHRSLWGVIKDGKLDSDTLKNEHAIASASLPAVAGLRVHSMREHMLGLSRAINKVAFEPVAPKNLFQRVLGL